MNANDSLTQQLIRRLTELERRLGIQETIEFGGTHSHSDYVLGTGGGTVVTGGYAFTIPADGTAALIGTTQTFSSLNTFSAGLKFAHDTLNYYDEGTFTPVVADDPTAGNTAAATVKGFYTRIGNIVTVSVEIQNIAKADLTSTNTLYVRGLPFAAKSSSGYRAFGGLRLNYFNNPTTYYVELSSGNTYVTFNTNVHQALVSSMLVSGIYNATLSDMWFSLTYLTD